MNVDSLTDLALTKFVFKAFIKACEVLEVMSTEAELLAEVHEILQHYPDYPTAQSKSGKVFVSVQEEDPEVVYNLPVGLSSVFPGEDDSLLVNDEMNEIAFKRSMLQQTQLQRIF